MFIDVPIGRSVGGVRSFPLAFRVEFLRQWDSAVERGAKVRLLREFNLSGSTVRAWVRARGRGDFEAGMVAAAGKSRNFVSNAERAELARLRRENERLRKKVEQSEAVQEILGKAFGLLQEVSKSPTTQEPHIPVSLMSAHEYQQWLQRTKLS